MTSQKCRKGNDTLFGHPVRALTMYIFLVDRRGAWTYNHFIVI